jgi:hypothetical protein
MKKLIIGAAALLLMVACSKKTLKYRAILRMPVP